MLSNDTNDLKTELNELNNELKTEAEAEKAFDAMHWEIRLPEVGWIHGTYL